jgi:hypothetical protein
MFMILLKIVLLIGSVAAVAMLLTEISIKYFGVEDAAWVGIAAFSSTVATWAIVAEVIDWFRFNRIKVVPLTGD